MIQDGDKKDSIYQGEQKKTEMPYSSFLEHC